MGRLRKWNGRQCRTILSQTNRHIKTESGVDDLDSRRRKRKDGCSWPSQVVNLIFTRTHRAWYNADHSRRRHCLRRLSHCDHPSCLPWPTPQAVAKEVVTKRKTLLSMAKSVDVKVEKELGECTQQLAFTTSLFLPPSLGRSSSSVELWKPARSKTSLQRQKTYWPSRTAYKDV